MFKWVHQRKQLEQSHLDETGNTGYDTSIAIDANDAVHIVYRDFTNGDLEYIALDASSTFSVIRSVQTCLQD